MKKKEMRSKGKKGQISGIGITNDTLTSRGGLSLFVRYLNNIGIMPSIERLFGGMRKSGKGQSIEEIFKQLLCYFVDGASRHLVYFDSLREDEGYARAIESLPKAMVSSHVIKRFFAMFFGWQTWLFRRLLQALFIWRLNLVRPEVVELGLDTMVMDNDEARKREGVEPTYKKVKGFQPLQVTWERFIVDAIFRRGSEHGNHGDTVERIVRHMVKEIRTKYRSDVPIILKYDSGFFDQKLFLSFEELGIGYIASGKLYDDIKDYVEKVDGSLWKQYRNKEQVWDYVEFMDRRGSWAESRRAIYCRPWYEGIQQVFNFARPETILYTNLGMEQNIDELLVMAGKSDLREAENIIESAHARGRNELVHRAFKDFGHEELPFKRFASNAAYYYTMAFAFFLFETFKEDVCSAVVPVTAYATTVRRKVIDCAAKLVKKAGKVILKVTSATWNTLKLDVLWERSGSPPKFVWV